MTTTTLHPTTTAHHRFHFMDALRGVAALFVVLFHLPHALTGELVANGTLAVDFFFCLSGFVIAFSYERRLTETLPSKTLSLTDFAVARGMRLYPLYALGTLVGFCFEILVGHIVHRPTDSWSHSLSLLVMGLFLWPTRFSTFTITFNYPLVGSAWSLFYEIVANFAYAFLIKLKIARASVLLCLVAGSFAILLAVGLHGGALDVGPLQETFGLGFARVTFSFFAGILICRYYRSRRHTPTAEQSQCLLPSVLTVALVLILSSPLSWMRTTGFHLVAIGLCFPAMVYYGALARLPHSIAPLCAALGELSYPLYLLHAPFVTLMNGRSLLHLGATHRVLAYGIILAFLAILALFAWWIGQAVDQPIRRMLTRRYNAFKQSGFAPTSPKESSQIQPSAHDAST